ncbi:MAG TPA: gluconate 2-dehydrogenase subunit 3 family protein [Thermomicrobiales bacterium]|nr:gluconate 2-dehydrogenase subunit 3 family protein [Thermomicrobiales bacterium]
MTNHEHPAPPDGRTIDRRRLLADASILTGGAIAAAVLGPEMVSASGTKTARPVIWLDQSPTAASPMASPGATPVADLETYVPNHLTEAELTTLKAVLDRIIPKDEYGPSANEMGVFVYIDKSFGGLHADALPMYQAGLAALDDAAGPGGFASLDDGQQDEILTAIEGGQQDATVTAAKGGNAVSAPAGFFGALLAHTREGMFSDPIYGGNVNFQGWDMVGYPGIKLQWTAEDQAAGSTPTPEHISVAKYREALS